MKKIIIFILCILLVSSVTAISLTDVKRFWKFNNTGTGFVTEEIVSDDAQNNGAVFRIDGIVNGDYYYNTNDYMLADKFTLPTNDITQSFTILLWLNWTCASNQKWVDELDGANDGITFGTSGTGRVAIFFVDQVAGDTLGSSIPCDTSFDGIPTHYAVTYNGTKINAGIVFYRNGSMIADSDDFTDAPANDLQADNLNLSIGATNSGGDRYVTGNIDEVMIYRRELKSNEIEEIYSWGVNGTSYPFNESISPPPPSISLVINTDLINNTKNYNDDSLVINYNGTVTGSTDEIFDCSLFVNDVINQSSNEVNLSNNQQFNINFGDVEQNFTFDIFCFVEDLEPLTSINLTRGTLNSGDITSIINFNDSTNMSINEVTGANSIILELNWTGVSDFNFAQVNYWYIGSNPHNMYYQLFNITSSTYDNIIKLNNNAEMMFFSEEVLDTDYKNGTNVSGRIIHTSAGNINHELQLDFVSIVGEDLNASSGEYIYLVDTINPIINTDFVNNTNYSINTILTLRVNFTDTNLYAYNITFRNIGNLSIIENIFAENLSSDFAENISTRLVTDFGNFSIKLESWDSHTSNMIKDYKIDNLKNGIELNDNVRITGEIEEFELEKEEDKYKFKIKFEEEKDMQNILIYMEEIKVIRNSEYKCHFISLISNNWIDFENGLLETCSIKRIDKNNINVTLFFHDDVREITFNSIGDLNHATETYFYEVISEESVLDKILDELIINNEFLASIWGEVKGMGTIIMLILFMIAFLIVGIVTRLYILWGISGGTIVIIAMQVGEMFLTDGLPYQKAIVFFFYFLGIVIIVMSVLIQIMVAMSNNKKNKQATVYDRIDYK